MGAASLHVEKCRIESSEAIGAHALIFAHAVRLQ